MISIDTSKNALIVESEDQDTMEQLKGITRYIHHHSSNFHLSSRSITPNPKPSVHIFRRPEYRSIINKITAKYRCRVWCFDDINQFGIFSQNNYNKMACIYDIRQYIHSVMAQDLDYIRCDNVCKRFYFSKTNESFVDLSNYCNDKYPSQYHIETKNCNPGYVWIWSKDEQCRSYIKEYIEHDLKYNWDYKYIDIEDRKLSVLFGRPHNTDDNQKRHNEFWKTFRFDDDEKCCYFWNKYNNKCRFYYKTIPNTHHNAISHKICVIVNKKHYNSTSDAKEALNDIALRVDECLNENMKIIDFCVEYQTVLTGCFAEKIHFSIRWDGDMESIYIKHDNNGEYQLFESMLFDTITPNTLIIEGTSLRELNILQRLIIDRMSDSALHFMQVVENGREGFSLVCYDEKLGDSEYRNNLNGMIEDIRQNRMDIMYIGEEFIPMIVGQNGNNIEELLRYCGLDTIERALIQTDVDGVMRFGVNENDERLMKLKRLIQSIIDHCCVMELTAKQWTYLNQYKALNTKLFQDEFAKCCISLRRLTADGLLFYGSDYAKLQIVNKMKLHD